MTLEELKFKIIGQLSEIDFIELFDLDIKILVDRFEDIILEEQERVEEYFTEEKDEGEDSEGE